MKFKIKPTSQIYNKGLETIKIETMGDDSVINGKMFAKWLYSNSSKAFSENFLLTILHLLIERKPTHLLKEIEEIKQFMIEREI